jgi:hypothetical protein
LVEQRGIEHPAPYAPSVVDRRGNDADRATQDDERRRQVSASAIPLEAALAKALEGAAKAGRWEVVAQLARELEARRARGDQNVVPLTRSLGMLVLRDDGAREYAYGPAAGLPDTTVGTFPQSLGG